LYRKEFSGLNGKIVTIDGHAHTLRVLEYDAIFPHHTMQISAEPVDRETLYYQEIKHQLGDDWSIDVASNPFLIAEILTQLVETN